MSQAPQDKGSSPSLRTVMPDLLRPGRKIQKEGLGPDFKGFPRSTFFLTLFILLVLSWCCGGCTLSSNHLPFLGLSILSCTMGSLIPVLLV